MLRVHAASITNLISSFVGLAHLLRLGVKVVLYYWML